MRTSVESVIIIVSHTILQSLEIKIETPNIGVLQY